MSVEVRRYRGPAPRVCVSLVERLETRTLLSADAVSNGTADVSPDDAELQNYVIQHEGLAQHVVKEPHHPPTIGAGFNLKRRGARALVESLGLDYRQLLREAKTPDAEQSVSADQAKQLLREDLAIAIADAGRAVANFAELNHRQQVGLVDLVYNLGYGRFKSLKAAVKALSAGDAALAAAGFTASKYVQRAFSAERIADDVALIQSPLDTTTPPPPPDPDPGPGPGPTPPPPVDSAPSVTPADAGTHGVRVSAGRVTLPGGAVVDVGAAVLNIDLPELSKGHTWEGAAPGNYIGQPPTQRWPDNSICLRPTVDTLILGGLYRTVIPSSVVVKDVNTGEIKTRDVDYKLNDDWGQVLNLNNRLGENNTGSLEIKYDLVKQRLDLIQVLPDGTVSVKRGTSAVVCPTLPSPDEGAVALAGVFVFTLDGAKHSGFAIQQRDILPIKPAAPVQPIHPGTTPNTLAKLRAGGNVNIAFFGDSITEGAEAGQWWRDRSKTYTGLVEAGLEARFPGANVTATLASQGGKGATDSQAVFQKALDAHNAGNTIDLLVINMGMNDKGKPSLDPFKAAMTDYIAQARAAGIEVLLVTPMQSNIFYEPNQTDRVPRLEIASAIKEVAAAQNATCVDVYTEWANLATRGIMPFSQLHNGFNHPGVFGMTVYADVIMRAFPAS